MANTKRTSEPQKRKFGGAQPGSGRKPKFDYDSQEFYDEIFALAFQGATDTEIAEMLDYKFHNSLNPQVFNRMKHGKYDGWNKAENESRGSRICQVLERARNKVNFIVRGRYLKAALGGIKVKSQNQVRRKLKIAGEYTEDEEIQTSTNEGELPPNIQALATWLYHHDKEWRNIQRGIEEEEDFNEAESGIEVSKWIEQEMKS